MSESLFDPPAPTERSTGPLSVHSGVHSGFISRDGDTRSDSGFRHGVVPAMVVRSESMSRREEARMSRKNKKAKKDKKGKKKK
jgi:hypothetical protein